MGPPSFYFLHEHSTQYANPINLDTCALNNNINSIHAL